MLNCMTQLPEHIFGQRMFSGTLMGTPFSSGGESCRRACSPGRRDDKAAGRGWLAVATHLDIVVFQRSATDMDIVFALLADGGFPREITRAATP